MPCTSLYLFVICSNIYSVLTKHCFVFSIHVIKPSNCTLPWDGYVRCFCLIPGYPDKILVLNPFIPSGFFYLSSLDRSIASKKGFLISFIITLFYRNSCTAASDLGLHCLPVSL